MGDLTTNFDSSEFKCPCCGIRIMMYSFIMKLQKAREIADTPFRITSGLRCRKRNKAVGGTENSSHLTGHAADIQAATSGHRYVIVLALLEAGLERIGVAKTFIHVDNSPEKTQGVMWLY